MSAKLTTANKVACIVKYAKSAQVGLSHYLEALTMATDAEQKENGDTKAVTGARGEIEAVATVLAAGEMLLVLLKHDPIVNPTEVSADPDPDWVKYCEAQRKQPN